MSPPVPVIKSMIVIISFIFLGGTCFMHVGSFLILLKINKKQKITKVKCAYKKTRSVQIVTVGSRVFVTSFQLAGVQGVIVESPEKALVEITRLMNDSSVGLVLVSDDVSKNISGKLTELRSKKSTPLVFELPAPGSQKGEVDYRLLLKQILGV